MKKLFKGLFLAVIISTLFVGNVFAAGNSYTNLESLINSINNSSKYTFEDKIDIKDSVNYNALTDEEEDEGGNLTITIPESVVGSKQLSSLNNISEYAEVSFPIVSEIQKQEYIASDEVSESAFIPYKNNYYLYDEEDLFTPYYNFMDKVRVKLTGRDGERGKIIDYAAGEVTNIADSFREDGIAPTWQQGAAYMNNEGRAIKEGLNWFFSVFLWALWVGFLAYELFNGACILFPVFRDKVTGDGANMPWYLSYNTKERLKNMEEEPMKKWFAGEVGRIASFFIISVGVFSGVIMWVISALINLIP